jgi:hypothetical protein
MSDVVLPLFCQTLLKRFSLPPANLANESIFSHDLCRYAFPGDLDLMIGRDYVFSISSEISR